MILAFILVPVIANAQGDLAIVIKAPDQALPGATISYTLMVTNSGPGDMSNVIVKMPAVANFNATVITCVSGMANNGSSQCPSTSSLTIALLQGTGVIVPSLPDGGTVTLTVTGTAATAANFTPINVTATVTKASSATEVLTTNNSSSYKTVIHSLINGLTSVYEFSAISSAASSTISPGGGTFNLVYKLISGNAVPELGTTFTIPCQYSAMQNRTGNGVIHRWADLGALNSSSDATFSLVPDASRLFSLLPSINKASLSWAGTMRGDYFFRSHLNANVIDPLGVFSITIGQIPSLPTSAKAIQTASLIRLYGSFTSSPTTGTSPELKFSTYITPIAQPLDNTIQQNSAILNIPYNNTYDFRYTAVLANGTIAPTDFMEGLFQWMNINTGTITYWTPCTNDPTTGTPDTFTQTGISSLVGFGSGWPGNVPNGFIAIESKNKGFVITRVANTSVISNPQEGMLIYDMSNSPTPCVKLFNGSTWKCLEKDCNPLTN